MTIEIARDIAAIVASAVTTVGVIVAGLWTYWLFIRQRLRFPKVDVTVEVQDELLSPAQRLVHVKVSLRNSGSVLVRSRSAELRLRQVVPVQEALRESVLSGYDPVLPDTTQVDWPMVAGREWPWAPGQFEIEPGESDALWADFVIDSSIEVIQLYFFLSNPSKGRADLGWTDTRLYRTTHSKAMSNKSLTASANVPTRGRSVRGGPQVRQQTRQQPQQAIQRPPPSQPLGKKESR